MRKLFVLFLILSANLVSAKGTDTLKVYTWEEALLADPEMVHAITFERMKLDSLPAELAKFKNLKKLDISKNRLTDLPGFLSDMDSLQELDAHKNKLASFPLELCSMRNIKRLILSRNEFEQIPECIQYMRNLAYLDLSDTPVANFPESFMRMPQLKTLSLHGLSYAPTFQTRWKEKLPWVRIEFDPPCNCLE